ncbi:2-phospho-L-lactate guanylyltransferase [Granulicoccus phenolivorans]|uniref:2-phospho-L-lactate guanylyltransferase n=1 Tax=Granulicoccus phenolivorans TaxID=266854 RepID=UPI0006864DFC|nr:2-phospho-L-lactate guanylyltransferase [Granulicoccus phenolivorans]
MNSVPAAKFPTPASRTRGETVIAVVPVKDLATAKSRLGGVDALRQRLALLMAADTIRALNAVVDRVIVVSEVPGIGSFLRRYGAHADVLGDPGTGLNGAFAAGAEQALALGADVVVACVADLPALTPATIRAVLDQLPRPGRGFVPDAEGTGTCLVLAAGVELAPAYGPDSARRHRDSGALELTAAAAERLDIDATTDLVSAAPGVGPATSSVLVDGQLGEHLVATIAGPGERGWTAVTAAGVRIAVPAAAVEPGLTPRPGQRVHLVTGSAGPISCWI